MHILITGGAGFIGSHLCEYLLQENHQVLCVDNLLTGRRKNLNDFYDDDSFRFVEHDVTEPFYYDEPVDWVFHMASPASPVDYQQHPIHTLKVGALGTWNMLGFSKEHNAGFLLASTSEVYGDPKVNPQPEDYWGNVNPIGPRGVYDEAKRYAEAMAMAYHRKHDVDTRIARIFNTFGPRMRLDDGRAVPNFIGQALRDDPITVYGDGSQTRSFCYISDLVKGLYKLIKSGYHLPVNLGNPQELSILNFAKKIKKLCNSQSQITYQPLPKDDPMQRKPDISTAEEELDWTPEVDLEEGIKKTIDYFDSFVES